MSRVRNCFMVRSGLIFGWRRAHSRTDLVAFLARRFLSIRSLAVIQIPTFSPVESFVCRLIRSALVCSDTGKLYLFMDHIRISEA